MCILLLEDLDAAFTRSTSRDSGSSGVPGPKRRNGHHSSDNKDDSDSDDDEDNDKNKKKKKKDDNVSFLRRSDHLHLSNKKNT